MFLKNWYIMLGSLMTHSAIDSYTNYQGDKRTVNYGVYAIQIGDKSLYSYSGSCSMNYMYQSLIDSSRGGVILGTGTTPPTIDDYDLSGALIDGYTYTAFVSSSLIDNGVRISGLYTITNTGTTEFTIGEIGLMANIDGALPNNVAIQYKALLERTVLDTPVTIPAGGVGQVTYTLDIIYPTA